MTTASDIYRPASIAKCTEAIAKLPESAFIPLPSIWCAENRYLPKSVSEDYGWWAPESAPHLVEIIDSYHPDDPMTHGSFWASVQSGKTVSVMENVLAFWIAHKLGSVLSVTATESLALTRASSAIDPMIDNTPLKNMIKPFSQRRARKTGDTDLYKEFSGGTKLKLSFYGSRGDGVGVTYNLIQLDELDKAPDEMAHTGSIEGHYESRTMATDIYKFFATSTGSDMGSSKIAKSFYEGDQRRRFVPCPICGEFQVLMFKLGDRDYGLTFDMKIDPETGKSVLDRNSVRYICKHCHKPFYESQKMEINQRGKWIPTWNDPEWNPHGYRPKSSTRRSWWANGLISKYLKWDRICQMFIDSDFGKNVLKFKTFVVDILAEEWARVEKQVSFEVLKNRAEPYCLGGEIPHNAGLMLFGFVDVQGDRLELGVLAVKYGMELHFIDHVVFFGDPANINDRSTWGALHEFIYSKTYQTENGVELYIYKCGIDVGYDPNEKNQRGSKKDFHNKKHTVYQFVSMRMDKFVALKGADSSAGLTGIVTPKKVREGAVTVCYHVDVSQVKRIFFASIGADAGPYSLHVPKYRKYGMIEELISDEWYKQILSERYQEIKPGVMGWKKLQDRNELLDLVIGNMAMMYMENINQFDEYWWEDYENEIRGNGI